MSENNAVANVDNNQVAGFGSQVSFDLLIRQAQLISNSSLVPEQFSIFDKKGKLKSKEDQKYALSNATIAMEMAGRIGASPLMVCQNLYIVHGRPGWSSQFIIAAINASGKFSPLRFSITEAEPEREITYAASEWENGNKVKKTYKEKIKNRICTAWAVEKETGERLESPPVSLEMAVQEGWYSKDGSKWQTMPDLMLRYRTATFFGRLYAPDLLMGIRTQEEIQDIIDITPETPITKEGKAADILSRFADQGVSTETGEMSLTAEEAAEVGQPGTDVVTDGPAATLTACYALIAQLAELRGETGDDLISNLTKGKIGVQQDLEGKPLAYLSDIKMMLENGIASEA